MTGVGLCLPQLGAGIDGSLVRTFCREAEDAGFTSLWVQEHIFFPQVSRSDYAGIPGTPTPDAYRSTLAATELLAAAASYTSSCTIGTSVLVGGYHRPVELAQRLATLDLLSEGRLVVGLGVGWSIEEHAQMDVDTRRRGARLSEMVDALRACWRADPVEHHGEFFDIPASYVSPKPVQQTVPLIAGTASRAGLARAVASFDGWNPAGVPIARVLRVLDELNALRRADQAPLTAWPRIFVQPPGGRPDLPRLFDEVAAARRAGLAEVIIDASFWETITEPADWMRAIEIFTPTLGPTP